MGFDCLRANGLLRLCDKADERQPCLCKRGDIFGGGRLDSAGDTGRRDDIHLATMEAIG